MGTSSTSDAYKYFIYSAQQLKERTEIEAKINKKFTPGQVVVRDKSLPFTELNSNGKLKYPDSYIVAEGKIKDIKYTAIKSL